MKIRFIPVLLLLIFPLSAQKKLPFSLQLEPSFGITFTGQKEYIHSLYDKNINISLLEWEPAPELSAGLNATAKYKKLSASAGINFSFPFTAGTMTDHDYSDNGINEIMLSYSDLYCEQNISSKLSFFYDLPVSRYVYLSPVISLRYIHTYFEAKDGYGWYSYSQDPWKTSPDTVFYPAGTLGGVNLTSDIVYIFTGLNISTFFKHAEINLGLTFSPYTYLRSVDHHYGKKNNGFYYEETANAWFRQFNLNLQISTPINRRLRFCVTADQTFGPATDGNCRTNRNSDDYQDYKKLIGLEARRTEFTTGIKISI